MKKSLKKIWKFLADNYFISMFFACIAFVGVVSIYKLFFVKPTYVYVKVKVGQGLWWASTQKPSMWYVEAFKKIKETQEKEKELTGKPQAEILEVRYYPSSLSNQYDVYLLMKLKVTKMGKIGKYNFKRSAIGVSSPVDFEFPSLQFSGTIIDISEKPIKEKYEEKIIYITKPFAYSFEYENIKIGDSYFDGQEKIVEILDKQLGESFSVITPQRSIISTQTQTRQEILIKIKIKTKKQNNNFLFAEEQVVAPGKTINIATNNFQFQDYLVAKVE